MERKEYMKEVYSKYWVNAREEKYGFSKYDKKLCEMILENCSPEQKILEVAIGTGEPIAHFLQQKGLEVHGIDISPLLVEKCIKINPNIKAVIGDAENLKYQTNEFPNTYCFHSTWYFPDFSKALKEMIRVTRPGGCVLFDILNKNNPITLKAYKKRILKGSLPFRVLRFGKNVLKVVFKVGTPYWHYTVFDVPTDPQEVYKVVKEENISDVRIFKYYNNGHLERAKEFDEFVDSPKLVFKLMK